MRTKIFRGTATGLVLAFLAGCSSFSSFEREATCVAAGATIGGAVGSMNEGREAVKGAIGGALVGALVCYMLDGDDDQDGVNNSQDECPGTPIGAKVDSQGCSIVEQQPVTFVKPVVKPVPQDEDLDGIVDASDLCPGTPAGAKVDEKGCPQVQNIVLNGVSFEFDSATLTAEANEVLLKQINVLKENPALKISITGHTDSFGAEKYNQILSLDRARAVRKFFVEQGIDGTIVTVTGAGELEPIADNATELGRSVNRRVELNVVREDS